MFNPLNQLRERRLSGKVDVYGTTDAGTVRVGGAAAARFEGATVTNFWGGHPMRPGSNAVSVVAEDGEGRRTEAVVGLHTPPENPQPFTYDANGNLTSDGQRLYTWDEENRLKSVESVSSVVKRRSEFLYDGQSRRAQRTDYTAWNGSDYDVTNTTRFIWDGWNLLAELITDHGSPVTNHHVWGLDLSGSLQGAGGIGGLLARVDGAEAYLYAFDGNGNVTDIVDTNGAIIATYEYDPFGRTSAQTGDYAVANPWRFSTKQIEAAWGLYYYGYRYYNADLGRWVNRDPIRDIASPGTRQLMNQVMVALYQNAMFQLNLAGEERLTTEGRIYFLVGAMIDLATINAIAQGSPALSLYLAGTHQYVFCHNNAVMYVDANGEFVPLISGTIGAVVGGISGGIIAAATGQSVWAGAAVGAATGAFVGSGAGLVAIAVGATGATPTMSAGAGVAAMATISAGAATVQNTANQVTSNMSSGQSFENALGNINMTQQGVSGLIGLVGGTISGGVIAAQSTTPGVVNAINNAYQSTSSTAAQNAYINAQVNAQVNAMISAATVNTVNNLSQISANIVASEMIDVPAPVCP